MSGSPLDEYWNEWMREDERLGLARLGLKQVSQALRGKRGTATARALQRPYQPCAPQALL